MEGLVFETRTDDAEYVAEAQEQETFDKEYQNLVAEESWKHPEKFGHIPSTFESHIAMLAKQSEKLGIVNEYSEDLLNIRGDLAVLQGRMMSYDDFYQMMCECPEDFGMSPSFVESVFNNKDEHAWHSGHEEHGKTNSSMMDKARKTQEKSKSKNKKTKRLNGWALLGIAKKSEA